MTTKKNTLSKRSEAKINDILVAAKGLFFNQGVTKTTVEEIVKESRVSKATFYKYFRSKDDIIEGLLISMHLEIQATLENLISQYRGIKMTLEDFLEIFNLKPYQDLMNSIFVLEINRDYLSLANQIQEKYYPITLRLFGELVRMAKIDGIIRQEIEAEVLLAYSAMVRYGLRRVDLIPSNYSIEAFSNEALKLYLYGILDKI